MNSINITIGGVKVKFPSNPYPSQISMMNQIIKGLQRKQNCLLESPTGSGKTLALLCSALAWQFSEKSASNKASDNNSSSIILPCFCDCNSKLNAKLNNVLDKYKKKPGIKYEYETNDEDSDEKQKSACADDVINRCPCSCHGMYIENKTIPEEHRKVPTIYFGTRTHKQIANVIKELRKTAYASEIKMTILSSRQHTCIHPKISKSSKKNELCRDLVKGKNLKNEDKELAGEYGCVFLNKWKKVPLSYEAINLEKNTWDIEDLVAQLKRRKICPYYAARDMAPIVDIIFCPYNYLIDPRIRSTMSINLKDEIVILDEAHNIEDACREATSFIITKAQLELAIQEIESSIKLSQPEEIIDAISYFRQVFDKLSGWISKNSNNLEHNDFLGSMSKVWHGIEIVAEFKLLGIGPETFDNLKKKGNQLFSEENSENVTDGIKLLIEHLILILDCLYSEEFQFMEDYRVAITKTKTEDLVKEEGDLETTAFRSQQHNNEWTFAINFWCLNSSVAFKYLTNCHSVVLCSGTLAPMETFQSELGCKFDFQLEANHVILEKQVWVGSLGFGPTKTNLQATFKNCETYAFQDEIGRLVLDICKTVPYGVLCFLPSYALLNKLINRWRETNMLEMMKRYKVVYSETRIAKDFNELLKEYYETIENSNFDDERNGALLFAVFRGRASEGLDFSDNYARAVIAVGIPFPNVKDVKVDLKRKYNNALCQKKKLLNGDEWYEIQAYRAVNQALGRCIRHRNDWGAIIMVDERYLKQPQKYSKGLSKWIRKQFNTYPNYADALSSIKNFVNSMKDFKKSIEIQIEEPIPLSIDSTCAHGSSMDIETTVVHPTENTLNETANSLESLDLSDTTEATAASANRSVINDKEAFKSTDDNFGASPYFQRKRNRQRNVREDRKKKSHNSKKMGNNSTIKSVDYNEIKGDKSLMFDEMILTDDESEDDFSEIKKIKEKMNLTTDENDSEINSSMATKVKKIQPSIASTFQPTITSTFRQPVISNFEPTITSTFQPSISSSLIKASQRTQGASQKKKNSIIYID